MRFQNTTSRFLLASALVCPLLAGCLPVEKSEDDTSVKLQLGDGGGFTISTDGAGEPAALSPSETKTVKGSGKVISASPKLGSFSSITFSAGDQLEITQGKTPSLTIEAEDNILPLLETTVRDGTLILHWKPLAGTASSSSSVTVNGKTIIIPGGAKNISVQNGRVTVDGVDIKDKSLITVEPQKPIVYRLTVPDLDKVTASHKGQITCKSFQTKALELRTSGSTRISFSRLEAEDVEARVSGSGRIALTGNAAQQDIKVSGSGSVDASQLVGKTARINVSGSGGAKTAVTATLDVKISGSGNVTYTGSPKITKSITGSGKLTKAE